MNPCNRATAILVFTLTLVVIGLLLTAAPISAQTGSDDGLGSGETTTMNANDKMFYDVHTKLAAKHIRLKNLPRAKEELELVLSAIPKNGRTHFRLAVVSAKMKDFTAAWRHLELSRAELGNNARFQAFEKQLTSAFPKPDNLSLDSPREALPAPKFQAETIGVFLVSMCETGAISSRIKKFETGPVQSGAFDLTLISATGTLDATGLMAGFKEIKEAAVQLADQQGSDTKKLRFRVTVTGQPATNPNVKPISNSEYTKLRDEVSQDADVSLKNARETEPDASGVMKGTYSVIGRDPRSIYKMINGLQDHLIDFSINHLSSTEFNQQSIWKGEITLTLKISG